MLDVFFMQSFMKTKKYIKKNSKFCQNFDKTLIYKSKFHQNFDKTLIYIPSFHQNFDWKIKVLSKYRIQSKFHSKLW